MLWWLFKRFITRDPLSKLLSGTDRRVKDRIGAASITVVEGKAFWIVGKSGYTWKCFSFGGKGILSSWIVRLYLKVLQLWREIYPNLYESQAIPTAVKGGILDSCSCGEKSILTCREVGLYLKLECGGWWSPHMQQSCSSPRESLYRWVLLHLTMQYLFLLLLCSPKGKSQQRYLLLLSSGSRGKPCRNTAIFSCTGDKLLLLLSSQGSFPAEILVSSALFFSQRTFPEEILLLAGKKKRYLSNTLKKKYLGMKNSGEWLPRQGEGQLTTEHTEGLI